MNIFPPLARRLQDDPSCQLCTILRRFIAIDGVGVVEESVSGSGVPALLTVQKGTLALLRQWKLLMHVPVEKSFKNKKKVNFVTFAVPASEGSEASGDGLGECGSDLRTCAVVKT